MKKLTKRLTALLLIAVMALSVIGCGGAKTPKTLWEAVREVEGYAACGFQSQIDVKSDAATATLYLENGAYLKRADGIDVTFDLSVVAEGKEEGQKIERTKVGKITVYGGVLYIDMSDAGIFDVLAEESETKIDDDMIREMLTSFGMEESDIKSTRVFSIEIGDLGKTGMDAYNKLVEAFIASLEEGMKDAVKQDGKKAIWTVEISDKDAEEKIISILKAVLKNYDAIFDSAVTIAEEAANLKILSNLSDVIGIDAKEIVSEMVADIKDGKDGAKEELQKAIDDPSALTEAIKGAEFTEKMTFQYEAKKDSPVFSITSDISMTAPEKMLATVNTRIEKKSVKITAPVEATDLMGIMESAIGMLGGMFSGGFSDEFSDDFSDGFSDGFGDDSE